MDRKHDLDTDEICSVKVSDRLHTTRIEAHIYTNSILCYIWHAK